MSNDSMRKHLRAALNEIISPEKVRLHEFYDKSDAKISKRIELMRPVIEALHALRAEIREVKGLSIRPASHGHMATVELNASASNQTLSISTTHDNTQFAIEERISYSFDSETKETEHRLSTANEVLEYVVVAVGKFVASSEVLHERRK